MRAGELRHVIDFDEPVTSVSSSGEESVTFTYAFSVRGSIRPVTGREQRFQTQVGAEEDTKLHIRWSPNVAQIVPKWRARHGGLVYDIKKINHVDIGQREIEMTATSGLNNG